MLKNFPSLKPRALIRILERGGCAYYREGKGDHSIYIRYFAGEKRVVPIDMGAKEFSPFYTLRIMRQFGFTDDEIKSLFESR
ncbi:MAG: type II toxin-antitoxin system HicA family toxin [Candidatus Magnetobacterium sp. LHC-1]|nr:type II toxin-antitoxin system HicA family toxin [Nitrospirota bacterium]